jgi:hypothetical protein
MNGVPASKHPMKMYHHKGNRLSIFWQWSASCHLRGWNAPTNTRWHPEFELPNIHHTYSIRVQHTVELPFNVPQFEGLTHLRLEKVDNFSIFLNLAFISILSQRNIKWGFSWNAVHKENLQIQYLKSVAEKQTPAVYTSSCFMTPETGVRNDLIM